LGQKHTPNLVMPFFRDR